MSGWYGSQSLHGFLTRITFSAFPVTTPQRYLHLCNVLLAHHQLTLQLLHARFNGIHGRVFFRSETAI